jgi:hypothetical protein
METLSVEPSKPDGVAVASLVSGIAQFVLLLPATVTAIACGHVARVVASGPVLGGLADGRAVCVTIPATASAQTEFVAARCG